jgi:hypothetical protein
MQIPSSQNTNHKANPDFASMSPEEAQKYNERVAYFEAIPVYYYENPANTIPQAIPVDINSTMPSAPKL